MGGWRAADPLVQQVGYLSQLRHIPPAAAARQLPPFASERRIPFLCSSSPVSRLNCHPFFPLQLPPSLASAQWWSAPCPWGVGCPARHPWKWPRIPSYSSSAQVPPSPHSALFPPRSCDQSFLPQPWPWRGRGGISLERHWSYCCSHLPTPRALSWAPASLPHPVLQTRGQ